MRAIDRGDLPTFDPAEALEGLSILDESLLTDDQLHLLQVNNNWNNRTSHERFKQVHSLPIIGRALQQDEPIINANGANDNDDGDGDSKVWQAILLEQRTKYEGQVKKLTEELVTLRAKVKEIESINDKVEEKSQGHHLCHLEREKWCHINKILDSYFAEYNVQI